MRLDIAAKAAAAVRRGHPWVYREAITRPPRDLDAGEVVEIVAGAEPLGLGLWDPGSPIAVRLHERPDPRRGGRAPRLDVGSFKRRLEAAVARRDALLASGATTALRLVHGEGDRVPGLVVDRYAHVAVVRTDGAAIAAWIDRLVPVLAALLGGRGVTSIALRDGGEAAGSRMRWLHGDDPPAAIRVRENGVEMDVDLARGQKTGAFLDQRDNRLRVRTLAAGRARALNLFSYAGGFSIAAALGGARHVTSVDVAAGAHATAQKTFRANGVDPGAHAFVTADAFDWLEKAAARGDRFDLVVSDPPSFAPNERSVGRALAAYARLHRLCAAVLAPGGVLCAASCSSHVGLEAFLGTLDDAALGRSDLVVRGAFGPPADHPTLAAFPEGRYLKLVELG
jgi:23S rRNA (cytosine1962-C5)-methyltransferase